MSKIISKEELKKHTEDDDQQWIVVEGKVIDVTKYKVRKQNIHTKYEHPGGADILLEHAGQEDVLSFLFSSLLVY
jgi:cytochrome b involved in lipid metabolism